jgi:hypothetical protein
VPALKHRDLQPPRGEIIAANQAIVAGADDENIAAFHPPPLPFRLSLSKPCPASRLEKEGQSFDKLRTSKEISAPQP